MSALPIELVRDVLHPLDRWTLDDVQFTDQRFLQVVLGQMSDVCLRQVKTASLHGPSQWNDGGKAVIHVEGRPELVLSDADGDTDRLFSEFLQTLRSSHVMSLSFHFLDFSPARAALLLQTPIAADALRVSTSNCAQLPHDQLLKVLVHFSPTSVTVGACHLRDGAVTDGFLHELNEKRVRRSFIYVDSFGVTDDAVVEFCTREDAPVGQKGDPMKWDLHGELLVHKGSFTNDLFRRLIQASFVSARTQSLRIIVSPVRFEEEDLRDFSRHLSYRNRGKPYQMRIYDFPGGANSAMDLQIVLREDNSLELVRARRPHIFFHSSDE